MADMLVKLYDLPPVEPLIEKLAAAGVNVRRARAYEKVAVLSWVESRYRPEWKGECDVAFSNHPVSCFIATHEGAVAGFACYESTCRNYFGPTGVDEALRGRGIGKALFLSCLHAMAGIGYAYAIIGGVGPAEFYKRVAGALEIPGSTPGIYRDRFKSE